MRFFFLLGILLLLNNCSFDNKSGIWKNEKTYSQNKNDKVFKDFKKITSTKESFNQTIPINAEFKFYLDKTTRNSSWKDIFYDINNGTKNYSYNERNIIALKTKKTTKYKSNENILFENDNIILSDQKGNIIIFSINSNSITSKFNFYKKKFKKINKYLNIIIEDKIIYISDNIGFIYAYNYLQKKILWAKNYKVPFRSNIKIHSDKIITSNQNNDFFILDKNTGNLVKLIPSEENNINNNFRNNIALSNAEIFILNTYGTLYSIDFDDFKLNWFKNLNENYDLNIGKMFDGSTIVFNNDKVLLSSNKSFYILDSLNGSIKHKKNFSSKFKPLINNDHIFLITKNNFLISMKLNDGKIIYSYDLNQKVADFTDTKKRNLQIKNFFLVNNKIFVFLKNSYTIKFRLNGEIDEIIKLPSKINSQPIFIDNYLMFLNKKNQLIVLN